jgi:hypothetical protein
LPEHRQAQLGLRLWAQVQPGLERVQVQPMELDATQTLVRELPGLWPEVRVPLVALGRSLKEPELLAQPGRL